MYHILFAEEILGAYADLKEALAAMEEFTTVGGYDSVIIEKVS